MNSDQLSKSAKRRLKTKSKTDKILSQIEKLKTTNSVPKLNPIQVRNQIDSSGEHSESLLKVISGIDTLTKNNVQRMRESAGLKLLDNWST